MDKKENSIPAIRLMRDSAGESFFETGKVRTHEKIQSAEFWFANEIDSWQVGTHLAPRKQFVVTLSGKLEFTTSDDKNLYHRTRNRFVGRRYRWRRSYLEND
ncbi:hypothetical protein SAMN05421765_1867 [Kaistella antarctica]|uniref:Cupin domain-containing protein n=1 Tax=Kaistella antarctica TaxID=266748 RepID=A0A3S4UXX2_9FLAO|nr:hypothetical protein SAMN05421765_1867 [Kaistella antarctica]VEH98785.1 Uncharacterised protein [Kaistella antarctica]